MIVKSNNKVYDVQPLELISKDLIDNNSLDYHLWIQDIVIEAFSLSIKESHLTFFIRILLR